MSEQTLLHVAEAEPTTCSNRRDDDCSRQTSCETETTEQETHFDLRDVRAILKSVGLSQVGSYPVVSGNICLNGSQHNGPSVTLNIYIQVVGEPKMDPVLQTRESVNIYPVQIQNQSSTTSATERGG